MGTVQSAPGTRIPQARKGIVHLIVVVAMLLALGVNLLAPVLAWQWTRRPFLGLFLEPALVISDVHNPNWPAWQAGLRNADRVLAIDGQAVATGYDVATSLAQKEPGQLVTLTTEPDPATHPPRRGLPWTDGEAANAARSSAEPTLGQAIETQVRLIAFPLRDFLVAFGLPYLLGLLYLGLGVAVYRVRWSERSGQVFALFSVAFSLFMGSLFDLYTYHWLAYFWTLSIPLIGATLFHLALVFPTETDLIRRFTWLRFVPYGPALFLGIYAVTTLQTPRAYYVPWRLCFAFVALSALGFIGLLVLTYFRAGNALIRQQARIIIWGSLIAFLPFVTWTLLNPLKAPIDLSSTALIIVYVLLAFFPASITYAIMRYRLLNLDLVLSRSLSYLGLTLLVTGIYFAVVSLVGWLFQTSAAADDPTVLALFVLALIFFLGPIRDRLQGLVDKVFLREKVDYRILLHDYGHELTSAPLKTERILALLLERCETALHPERAVVFLRDPILDLFSLRDQIGVLPSLEPSINFDANAELPHQLSSTHIQHPQYGSRVLHLSFEGGNPPPGYFSPEELKWLSTLCPGWFVPLYGTNQLIGWITIGPKRSGQPYHDGDVIFLTTLASQTAIALENAQLLEATERRALQLATLNQVGRVINQTLDLKAVLQLIMEKSLELLGAEAGSLLLVDDTGEALTFEVVLGPVGQQLQGARVALGSGIVGTVAREKKPLIVNNVQADSRWNISFDQTTDFTTRSLICVPMITRDRLVGVIEAINKHAPSIFTEEDTQLLGSFAAQAAIAIENARLFTSTDQALAERVQELQTLQVIDRQLNATLDSALVMELTLEHAMNAVNASAGVVGVIDEEQAGLYLIAQRGVPTEYERYRDKPWPMGKSLMEQAARAGKPLLSGRAQDVSNGFKPLAAQTRSQMIVPILYQGTVSAMIDLESAHPNAFSQQDVDFVTRLADHAAIAIENARLYQHAQAANQAKTEFMSVASHELKTPMTSIKGYAKLLALGVAGELTERQRDFLSIIGTNVDRMDRLVADLLDVSRIEAGRLRLDLAAVDMHEVVDSVVESVRAQIDAKELTLEVSMPSILPRVWGDQGRLMQILTNLVSNAYKYTPNGGLICISVNDQGDGSSTGFLTISVRDTGVGISSEDQQKLFSKFFRADDPRIRKVPGTGLGLSITKSLVETHGGQIWFESEPDRGTTFTLTLPVAPVDHA